MGSTSFSLGFLDFWLGFNLVPQPRALMSTSSDGFVLVKENALDIGHRGLLRFALLAGRMFFFTRQVDPWCCAEGASGCPMSTRAPPPLAVWLHFDAALSAARPAACRVVFSSAARHQLAVWLSFQLSALQLAQAAPFINCCPVAAAHCALSLSQPLTHPLASCTAKGPPWPVSTSRLLPTRSTAFSTCPAPVLEPRLAQPLVNCSPCGAPPCTPTLYPTPFPFGFALNHCPPPQCFPSRCRSPTAHPAALGQLRRAPHLRYRPPSSTTFRAFSRFPLLHERLWQAYPLHGCCAFLVPVLGLI